MEPDFDLFENARDLAVGVGAGDGALSRGSMMVDDLRVYDVALPRETAWATTACPL